jgi:hypothetical protein
MASGLQTAAAARPPHQVDMDVIVMEAVRARREHGGELLARRPLHVAQEALLLRRSRASRP